MSLQYLLDGYNIINQIPELDAKKLEDRREGLICLIEHHRPQGSLKNKVTVVFDGKADVLGTFRPSVVKVIFTKDETADEKIKRLVQKNLERRSIVVVTDDRAIKYAVRALGAKVCSVKSFLSKIPKAAEKAKTSSVKTKTTNTKRISRTLEHKITAEFEEIWLGKKK